MLKAFLIIVAKIEGICFAFTKIIDRHIITYVRVKKGIRTEVILVILLIPPKITKKASTVNIIPKING